jgi:hypothetical protein
MMPIRRLYSQPSLKDAIARANASPSYYKMATKKFSELVLKPAIFIKDACKLHVKGTVHAAQLYANSRSNGPLTARRDIRHGFGT